jgi:hypothetical protein
MRGKKVDNEFLTEFISACAMNNKCSPQEIVLEAEKEISQIEESIKELQKLKLKRSKLLDVITTFNYDKKQVKQHEINNLHFFKIKNQHICKFICDLISVNGLEIDSIKSNIFLDADILYCIKQLLEYKIIYRTGTYIIRGDNYQSYYKAVFENNETK